MNEPKIVFWLVESLKRLLSLISAEPVHKYKFTGTFYSMNEKAIFLHFRLNFLFSLPSPPPLLFFIDHLPYIIAAELHTHWGV
jgi:hypothetical protein